MFMYDENTIPHPLYRVTLIFDRALDGAEAELISETLDPFAVSVFLKNEEATDGDRWTVEMTSYGEPDLEAIFESLTEFPIRRENVTSERVQEKDWLRHVHDNFPPVTIGRFFVYGSHYEGEKPKELTPLQIDAATAFGSGEHETTKGCMIAFEFLNETHKFKNALDMGCGSGILGIAIQKIWGDAKITAVDIDPESIIVTDRHAKMNDVTLQSEAGDGYRTAIVSKNGPYDLIAANILAGPLIDMAPDLDANLTKGGFCVLSGLLARQEKDVTAAHEKQGLKLVKSIEINDWRALVFEK